MNTITLKAHAKINPSLDVLAKRPDGYHEVRLIMQLIELHDFVMLTWTAKEAAPQDGRMPFTVRLTCDDPSLAVDETNLAHKAVMRLAEKMVQDGRTLPCGELAIHIEKRIPVAAGLAGGSADGAAALLGASALWETGYGLEELLKTGALLGADVPFAMMGAARTNPVLGMKDDPLAAACAVGEGTGTALTVLPPVDAHILLVKPPIGVSTAAAYQGVDAFLEGAGKGDEDPAKAPAGLPQGVACTHPDIDGIILALNKHDLFSAREKMGNTLELYTLKRYHDVAYTKCKIQECVLDGVALMSGSGPTIFLLAPEEEEVRRAYDATEGIDAQRIMTKTVV